MRVGAVSVLLSVNSKFKDRSLQISTHIHWINIDSDKLFNHKGKIKRSQLAQVRGPPQKENPLGCCLNLSDQSIIDTQKAFRM